MTQPSVKQVWEWLETIPDPEIPVITLVDLGIIRNVEFHGETCIVSVTPTYSGCPAMRMIEFEIIRALDLAGFDDAKVETVLSPAWTTDWMTETGKAKLRDYGIAPPKTSSNSRRALFGEETVSCPKCGSDHTERVSEFGSTACKALYRGRDCAEPFDYFKCI